jgi:NADH-quinone oxidoreductase subunit N
VGELFVVDAYGLLFTALLCAAALGALVLAREYFRRGAEDPFGEFATLLVLGTLGAATLPLSRHFFSFFLGLELLSVSLYGLIAYPRGRVSAGEAGLKYLILHAAAAAFLLFGLALAYGESGAMEFERMGAAPGNLWSRAGAAMALLGIAFKLALVPAHGWAPDVYEGAPAPATAFVATVSKGAVLGFLVRHFGAFRQAAPEGAEWGIGLVAAASMTAGNLLALLQDNVKRLLAYSATAQAGYVLVAVVAGGSEGVEAATFFAAAYMASTLAVFAAVTALSEPGREAESLEDYQGLFWRRPWTAALLAGGLLSLAGVPLTAGFVGKVYLVAAGAGAARWALLAALVVNSAIGFFVYMRVVAVLYRPAPGPEALPAAEWKTAWAGAAPAAIVFVLGVWPEPLQRLIRDAALALR